MLNNRVTTIALLIALCAANAPAAVSVRRRGESALKAYQRVELEVKLDRTYQNPFDPDEISVDAKVMSPDGKQMLVPGFWGEDFPNAFQNPRGGSASAVGEPSFRIRFCPTRAGRWSIVVIAKDRQGTSESAPITMDVAAGDGAGFIRVSPSNHQYLQFDSGLPYFPIGLNLCWTNGKRVQEDVTWFESLKEAKGNFARAWLCHPPLRIENERVGLGQYDLRNAAFFDDLLDLAQQDGIYVMLTMNNHRELLNRDMWGSGGWVTNPYNSVNGGPATRPIDFFTSEEVRQFHKRRLRYLVARYSCYTSLMCWELFNEQENAQLKNMPDSWNEEMSSYLHQLDPYDHLVSTSATLPEAVWKMPSISITQSHHYGDGGEGELLMPILDAPRRHAQFDKPHFIAEAGISYKSPDATFDPANLGTAFHNSLWASTMSGACGASAYWWWDNYIAPGNLWHELTPVVNFAATVDWPTRHFKPVLLPSPRWNTNEPEQFTDLVIKSSGGGAWGKADPDPIVILPNGQVSHALPYYLYGPRQEALRTRTTLSIDLPRNGAITLHVGKVSDYAALQVIVDGAVTNVFNFGASPAPTTQPSPSTAPEKSKPQQTVIDEDRVVALSAGPHTIELPVTEGDWLSVDRITFSGAKSSLSADLMTVAIQDESAGETIAWLYDATSNWKADRDGTSGRKIENVSMTVPISRPGKYAVQWWDTRGGSITRIDSLALTDGALTLKPPVFSRDVAVHIAPAERR